jgi:hypothetical protein
MSPSCLLLGPLLAAAGTAPQPGGAATATASAAPAAEGTPAGDDEASPPPSVDGLYPLWEQTGTLEEAGAARVGYGHANVGLGPVAVGTQPFLDLYGVPNGAVKVALLRRPRVRLALVAGAYHLPAAAEQRGIGRLHASTFANPFAAVWLLPVSLAATVLVTPRLHLHGSAVALAARSDEPGYRSVTGGVTGFAEWFATRRWSARLHLGSEGWPAWPQAHAGLSFGWRARHLALAAGYARRFDPGGLFGNVVMLDGALLFP